MAYQGQLNKCSAALFVFLVTACGPRHAAAPRPVADPDSAMSWIELLPGMTLKLESAYYREGSARNSAADYLGTTLARYTVQTDGRLKQISLTKLAVQPRDQTAVENLISPETLRRRKHTFSFRVALNRKGSPQAAVLLGANSEAELDRVAAAAEKQTDTVCAPGSTRCAVFPPLCTASLEIAVTVNDEPRNVLWSTAVMGITGQHPTHVELSRRAGGKQVEVPINAADMDSLRTRLRHGDRVTWR
jgi:hypothetical protein